MRRVFADTSYFVAMIAPSDANHQVARNLARQPLHIVSTTWVLTELAAYLCKPPNRKVYLTLLRSLENHPNVDLVDATHEQFDRGTALYAARTDKEWSLIDCISFELMRRERLTEALTADHHFVQAGFTALLPVSRS